MDASLLVGLIHAHSLVGDLLARALADRGHRVIGIELDHSNVHDFAIVGTRCSSCHVYIVCAWGIPRDGLHLIRHLFSVDQRRRIVLIEAATFDPRSDGSIRSGATAVIGPHSSLPETLDIIESAARGDSHVSSTEHVSAPTSRLGRSRLSSSRLSPKETEVLQLVVDGFDIARIAALLYISPKTVKHHLSTAYSKLEVTNRTDAVVRALRDGLIDLPDV